MQKWMSSVIKSEGCDISQNMMVQKNVDLVLGREQGTATGGEKFTQS